MRCYDTLRFSLPIHALTRFYVTATPIRHYLRCHVFDAAATPFSPERHDYYLTRFRYICRRDCRFTMLVLFSHAPMPPRLLIDATRHACRVMSAIDDAPRLPPSFAPREQALHVFASCRFALPTLSAARCFAVITFFDITPCRFHCFHA